MIDRTGEVITEEALHLAVRRGVGVPNDGIYNCRLTDCRVRIGYPRGVTIFCSTFVNTIIEMARTAAECGQGCFFDSCTFKGKYDDCRFGLGHVDCSLQPGLRNCDFTGATLNLCSFFNCTPDDLRLPGWPHVTIFYPRQNAEDFADIGTDPVLADIQGSMCNSSPDKVGLTYHVPSYAKQFRPWMLRQWETRRLIAEIRHEPPPPEPVISLETIQELLRRKPYVFM